MLSLPIPKMPPGSGTLHYFHVAGDFLQNDVRVMQSKDIAVTTKALKLERCV